MAEKEDKSDKAMEEAIKKVGENPQYKVLTREEYEALMKGAIPKTSTPRVHLTSFNRILYLYITKPGNIQKEQLRQYCKPRADGS